MKLLLLSNSRNPNEKPFEWVKEEINAFFGDKKQLALVPFAGVTITWDEYAQFVRTALEPLGFTITSVHEKDDVHAVIRNAEGILVGGGNTFQLTNELYRTGLLQTIHNEVQAGKPYLGWSAGSNITCPTLGTTNDMPIVQPPSFKTFNFVPFQLNPHYLNLTPTDHGGETRDDRLNEFIAVNPDMYVIGLPEGCLLHVENGRIQLVGSKPVRIFRQGIETRDYTATDDLQFLMDS